MIRFYIYCLLILTPTAVIAATHSYGGYFDIFNDTFSQYWQSHYTRSQEIWGLIAIGVGYFLGFCYFLYGTCLGKAIYAFINYLRSGRKFLIVPNRDIAALEVMEKPRFWHVLVTLYQKDWKRYSQGILLSRLLKTIVFIFRESFFFIMVYILFLPQRLDILAMTFGIVSTLLMAGLVIGDVIARKTNPEYREYLSTWPRSRFKSRIIAVLIGGLLAYFFKGI